MSENQPSQTSQKPVEHEAVDGSFMADEAALEQQMETSFARRQAELSGQPAPDATPESQPQPKSPPSQTEPAGDLNLATQLEAAFPTPTESPVETPPSVDEKVPEEANDRVKYLQQVFKDTLGVDVQEAVATMTNFNETAQGTIAQLQQMENNIAAQQQRLELTYAWGADAQALGVAPSQLVDDRLAEATRVYSSLNDDLRKRIASQGSKGIIELYSLIQKNRGGQNTAPPQTTVPQGRATVQQTQPQRPSEQDRLDAISLKSEEDFWKRQAELYG